MTLFEFTLLCGVVAILWGLYRIFCILDDIHFAVDPKRQAAARLDWVRRRMEHVDESDLDKEGKVELKKQIFDEFAKEERERDGRKTKD
jgi:hypothetical protein